MAEEKRKKGIDDMVLPFVSSSLAALHQRRKRKGGGPRRRKGKGGEGRAACLDLFVSYASSGAGRGRKKGEKKRGKLAHKRLRGKKKKEEGKAPTSKDPILSLSLIN